MAEVKQEMEPPTDTDRHRPWFSIKATEEEPPMDADERRCGIRRPNHRPTPTGTDVDGRRVELIDDYRLLIADWGTWLGSGELRCSGPNILLLIEGICEIGG